MKKILSLLASIGLTATTSSFVVACQTEITGSTLKDLAQKINANNVTIAVANPPLVAKDLKDNIVVNLTKFLVEEYGMNKEGYFNDSKIQTLIIGELKILINGEFQVEKIEESALEKLQKIVLVIDNVSFNFQINFSFNHKVLTSNTSF